MTINNQNIILPIGEYLDAKINSFSIKNINEIKKEIDYNTFLKNLSDDKKFAIVTEKADEDLKNHNELRFQEYTPVARPLESSTIFNETKKVKRTRKNFYRHYYSEEETQKSVESKNEKGFYIIIDGMIFQPEKKNEELSYIQKRINKIYHLNYARDPGTLVNVIA